MLVAAGAGCVLAAAFWAVRRAPPLPVSDRRPTVESSEGEAPAPSGAPTVDGGPFRFSEVREGSGVDFVHTSGDSPERPFPAANGSGLAAFDYDLDGLADLYFLTGTQLPVDHSRLEPTNRCYRNLGDWKFVDVSALTGLAHNGFSAGVAVGDFDRDGFADLFLNCYGPDRLFRNLGDGTFVDETESAGINDSGWGTSAAFFDYDGDGLLDLFACNYAYWSLETNEWCGDRSRGVRIFCNPTTVEPAPSALFRNSGDGTFRNALAEAGLDQPVGRAQGIVAADVNGDHLVDLYVANDLHPNFLFLNNGRGGFTDFSEASGAAHDYQGRNQAGMGVDIGDTNHDGLPELFVTNFEGEHNALYANLGNATFQDVSRSHGLAAESVPWVGWGTQLVDLDLDGWLDVIVTNGHTDYNLKEMGRDSPYEQPPGLWRNERGRFRFVGGASAGDYFGSRHVGRGLAVADFNDDGKPDVVIVHQNAPPALLRNDGRRSGRGIRLRLVGIESNRDAVGAEITLSHGMGEVIVQQVKGGGSYASASDLRQIIACPEGTGDLTLQVVWPSGRKSTHVVTGGGYDFVIRELDQRAAVPISSRAQMGAAHAP